MLDHEAALEAFRDHLETVVVATTGSMALASSTAGFTRLVGSFDDDGFRAGMEVVGTGFPGTIGAASVIKTVDDLAMPIVGGRVATASASPRVLTVGLPLNRQWQGTQTSYADVAVATRPYVNDQWVPGVASDAGAIVDTGFYVVNWNGLANQGASPMLRQMMAVRDHFPPGLTFVIGTDRLRVTGNPAPNFTQPITLDNGFEVSTLRIPWRAVTTNLDPA